MTTIYLHIGTPKTGTTAIQDFLRNNDFVLEKNNYCFPVFSVDFLDIGPNRNGQFLHYIASDNKPDEYYKCNNELKQYLKTYKNIILSDEGAWFWQKDDIWWKRVKEWAGNLGIQLKIIVYLRKQEELIDSMWNQKIKGYKKWTASFDEFLSSEYCNQLPLDYEKALSRIEKYIGIDNMIVRLYDFRSFYKGNICKDFLNALGLDITNEYNFEEKTSNISMPPEAVEVKRMINSNCDYQNTKGVNFYMKVIREAYNEDDSNCVSSKLTMFSDEELTKIREKYGAGNKNVARRYMKENDEEFFLEEKVFCKWEPDDKKLLSESVRILAGSDLYLYKQIQDLKQEIKELNKEVKNAKKGLIYNVYKKIKKDVFR
ncbi:MAG: hypothetical protein K6B41_08480 [Butyrivibrio sp.]|nr:hypothetical protein [Butyrivibrio sp.]